MERLVKSLSNLLGDRGLGKVFKRLPSIEGLFKILNALPCAGAPCKAFKCLYHAVERLLKRLNALPGGGTPC